MAKKKQSYQAALEELETILQNLQDGKISIDDLMEQSARATELIALCRKKLRDVEGNLNALREV